MKSQGPMGSWQVFAHVYTRVCRARTYVRLRRYALQMPMAIGRPMTSPMAQGTGDEAGRPRLKLATTAAATTRAKAMGTTQAAHRRSISRGKKLAAQTQTRAR